MANIRIKDLPSDTAPSKTDTVPIDLGTTRHATVEEIVLAGRPTATKTEAEAGIDPKKAMTPLTTKQAIDAQVAPNFVPQATRLNSGTGLTGGAELTGNVTLSLNAASIASLANADSAVQPSRTLTAGTGLSGLGDLSADRTVSLNQSSIDSLSRADSAIQAPGGTTGQVLFKESNLENHVSWRSIAAATAVSYTPQVLSESEKTQARTNIEADKVYDTVADVQASTIDPSVMAIRTNGYYAAGDGGDALYVRVVVEPNHAGKIQSFDGAWWELAAQRIVCPEYFGAIADGATDCADAIQNAIDFCAIKSVDGIGFRPKTYSVSRRIRHKPNVSLFGVVGVFTIKALAGIADTLFATDNYELLVAAGNSSSGGSQNFTISDAVFDANMAENGANTSINGDGIALYGRNFLLRNVRVAKSPRHGLVAYYVNASGAWGISPYNANLDGVTIDECGGHGIYWSISDSNWNNINVASPSQLTDNGFDAVVINSLVRWSNGAIWKKGSSTNFHRYGIHSISGGSSIVGVNIETAKTYGVFSEGNRCHFDVWIYNNIGKYSFYNTGGYNIINLRVSGSFQQHTDATAMYNSGVKNIINTNSTGGIILHEFGGGNHNIIRATGFVGSKPSKVGSYGAYDKADIIGETNTGTNVSSQLGAVMRHGASNVRPSYGAGNYGTYFDTTLNKLIIWNGAAWVDTMGAAS